MRRLQPLLLAALLALAGAWPVSAQVTASIFGVVTDASGGTVAGATVTVRNIETGAERTTVTDGAGSYRVLALPIGVYQVKVA